MIETEVNKIKETPATTTTSLTQTEVNKIKNKANITATSLTQEETEFITKLHSNQYISNNLYQLVKAKSPSIIPTTFSLETHNTNALNIAYQKYKDYFTNMYTDIDPSIHLDEEQIKAILSDEDYCLILAGAGTGKTTTMASKVKFIVDIKKINPSKILVMSYTKKATEELEKRIVVDFQIPARVTTFHSLGLMYIREIFKEHRCFVVDTNYKNKLFLDYFKEKIFPDKAKLSQILQVFTPQTVKKKRLFSSHFQENYDKYPTFQEYFNDYKQTQLSQIQDLDSWINQGIEKSLNSEVIHTLKGELVKSKGEAQIANFLYRNNIPYEYEKVYEKLMPENRTYRPDFTIEYNGMPIYIEYFGLSTYKENELSRYNKIKKIKEYYHAKHHTNFIAIDYQKGEIIEEKLKTELQKLGIKLKPKSNLELFSSILDQNESSQFYAFRDFIYSIIEKIKSSKYRTNYEEVVNNYINALPEEERKIALVQYNFIDQYYKYYQSKLYSGENYGFDFSDMIYYANKYIHTIQNTENLSFDYLIIDEYQDISEDRYILAKQVSEKNSAKVVAVGDDWQSIYSFAGSKIEYIYNFTSYFPTAKYLKISKAYRNSRQLIEATSSFIMENKEQIPKTLISTKENTSPIKYIMFEDDEEYQKLKELILQIHQKNKDSHIMILGRTNEIIKKIYDDPDLKDSVGTKIKLSGYDADIDGMTIHKSKGLTSDEVIMIGLNDKFPRMQGNFWLIELLNNHWYTEKIPFAEERRLFYVALTRTKNNVYLLVNKDPLRRSSFVNEIYNISNENKS